MSYWVSCGCGARHAVLAVQAGSTLPCACGRTVDVPLLSALRRSAGEHPIPLNTVERIQAMIQSGDLPGNDLCPYSGRLVDCTIFFHVQCESAWTRGGDSEDFNHWMIFGLLFGWIGLLAARRATRPIEELGRDNWVQLPLRVSSDVAAKILKIRRQKTLKELLAATPIYAELFQEFPGAAVKPLRVL